MLVPELGCAEDLPDPRFVCSGSGQPQALLRAAACCEPCSLAPAEAEGRQLYQGQATLVFLWWPRCEHFGFGWLLACFPLEPGGNEYLQRTEPAKILPAVPFFQAQELCLGVGRGA